MNTEDKHRLIWFFIALAIAIILFTWFFISQDIMHSKTFMEHPIMCSVFSVVGILVFALIGCQDDSPY